MCSTGEKKSYRYSSQGSTIFKFQQKMKQMLSYEFGDEGYFADNKLQVAQVLGPQLRRSWRGKRLDMIRESIKLCMMIAGDER